MLVKTAGGYSGKFKTNKTGVLFIFELKNVCAILERDLFCVVPGIKTYYQ